MSITDDDTAGVSIDPTALTVAEGDLTGATYTVELDTQPSADVTVTITGYSGTDIALSGTTLSPTNVLTFTPVNWNAAQTVTVTAAADAAASADQAVTLSHALGGADEYQAIPTADVPGVTVTITEKDSSTLSVGDVKAGEGDVNVVFTVAISAAND